MILRIKEILSQKGMTLKDLLPTLWYHPVESEQLSQWQHISYVGYADKDSYPFGD